MNKNMDKSKQKVIGGVVVAVLLMGASFWGGTVYAKHTAGNFAGRGQFSGTAANGQFGGRTGGMNGTGGISMRGGQGFTAGDVIAKDDSSITIKMQDGSTKIVLVNSNTEVLTSDKGTLSDVTVGEQVSVSGQGNSDGSVTAKSIQIRPAAPASTSSTPQQ